VDILEYWVEENIRPNIPTDLDRVLFEHIKPIVFFLKSKGWIITWHFLLESPNWRGRGEEMPQVLHIRLRVRADSVINIRKARKWLKKVLDGLQRIGRIAAHYEGKHGTPNQYYRGEKRKFNQRGKILHRNGWDVTQKWLESGSEIALIFLECRLRGVHLGPKFSIPYMLHFFADQCEKRERALLINNVPFYAIET
jgi:hypothetical protein